MNRAIVIVILFLMVIPFSCKNETVTDDVMDPFESISKSRDYSQIKQYYTEDTINAVDRAVREGMISKTEGISIINYMAPKSKWEKISKKVSGDTAEVSLQFTEHPVDNLVGFILNFKLKKEDGKWKIDMADEVGQVLKNRSSSSSAKYIENL